ncbi:MAG: polyphosphate polymerase domain-containing protein [Bacteroidetes bacterium]|nr:polyphosphate polymerase domain-containing protein [Bacteroidota bacterium]
MPYPKLEYKYLLPAGDVDAVRRAVHRHMAHDAYALRTPEGSYVVRSVYFDSPRLGAYREKVEGVRSRRKYRIRAYGAARHDSAAFLEIKEKQGQYLTKFRSALAVGDVEELTRDRDFGRLVRGLHGDGIDPANAELFFRDVDRKALRPVVLVVYDREAFTADGMSDLRVTIDSGLRSQRVADPGAFGGAANHVHDGDLVPVMRQHAILEVKFTRGVPAWLRDELRRHRLRRLALSKYTLSLDAHAQ